MKTLLSLFAVAVVAAGSAHAQIITYDFGTTTGQATPSSDTIPGFSAGTVSLANFASVAGTGGSGLTTSSASTGYTLNANGTSVPASGNYQLAFNQLAAGALDLTNSSYIQFTLTPEAGAAVELGYVGFGARVLSDLASATTYSIRSSLDGYATSLATQTFTQGTVWRGYNNTVSLTGAVDQAVTLRIYFYGSDGTSRSGNTRIDDLTLSIPEPSTYALLGLGVFGLLWHTRRRRVQA